MTLKHALRGGFGAALVALLGVVCLTFLLLGQLIDRWTELSTEITQRDQLMQRCSQHLGSAALYFHGLLYENINGERLVGELDMVGQQLDAYERVGALSAEEARLLARAREYLAYFHADAARIGALHAARADRRTIEASFQAENDKLLGLVIRKLVNLNTQRSSVANLEMDRLFHRTSAGLLIATLTALAGLGAAWRFTAGAVIRHDAEREDAIKSLRTEIRERELAEERLQNTTRMLETLVSNLPGNAFRFRYHSNGLKELCFIGGPLVDRFEGMRNQNMTEDMARYRDNFGEQYRALLFEEVPRRLRETGFSQQTFPHAGPDGGKRWVRAWERVVETNGDEMVTEGLALDVTEEIEAKQSLERVNRILRTLSQANEALVRATDEEHLFTAMCNVIVGTGGYRMAWVGISQTEDGPPVTMACAGQEDGILNAADHFLSANEGAGREALRTGTPQVCANIAALPVATPWRKAALERGYQASIVLPLKLDDERRGLLGIYADEAGAFGPEETALFVDLANDLSYGFAVMRERERRAKMERLLAHSQKMEALGRLAGSVAHDFNNLLGAIMGFARFIAEDHDGTSPAHYYATRIMTAGDRGKAAINQILSFAHRGEIKRERVALSALVAEVQTMAAASLPASTRMAIHDDLPGATVEGDPGSLTRMLLNLCVNASDALGEDGGTVTLRIRQTARLPYFGGANRTRDITTWEEADGTAHCIFGNVSYSRPSVSLEISDTGSGMNADILEKAFAPFFTTKGRGGGTGLGLAVVHGTIQGHDGAMLVESRVGHGSRFEVVLPLAEEVTPALSSSEARVNATPVACRVLLVDDDPDFGDMVLTGLERSGIEVAPCSDPLVALAGFKEAPDAWDVLVTDQTMPGMSGLELIRQVRAIRPDMPCILCTGYAHTQLDGATLLQSGIFARLPKPLDMNDLLDTLARAVG